MHALLLWELSLSGILKKKIDYLYPIFVLHFKIKQMDCISRFFTFYFVSMATHNKPPSCLSLFTCYINLSHKTLTLKVKGVVGERVAPILASWSKNLISKVPVIYSPTSTAANQTFLRSVLALFSVFWVITTE